MTTRLSYISVIKSRHPRSYYYLSPSEHLVIIGLHLSGRKCVGALLLVINTLNRKDAKVPTSIFKSS